jgi:hypothetical protein
MFSMNAALVEVSVLCNLGRLFYSAHCIANAECVWGGGGGVWGCLEKSKK